MFKINYEEVGKEFGPIAEGDYEVTVVNYEMKKSSNGNDVISLDYEIRSDVQQPHQGVKVLYDNFTLTKNAMWKVNAISKALGIPHDQEFQSYTQWANTVLHKNLIITVKHKEPNASGRVYPEVKSYKGTKLSAPQNVSTPIEVSDDELPF